MSKPKRFEWLLGTVIVLIIAVTGYNYLKSSQAANADINGDGKVNVLDLSIMASNWGKTGMSLSQGDLNGDGTVNVLDLSILAANWGIATDFKSIGLVDIRTHGAIANDGIDDSAAIQASLDEAFQDTLNYYAGAYPRPMAVYIPPGTWDVSQTLKMYNGNYSSAAPPGPNWDNVHRPSYQIIGSTVYGQRPIIKLKNGATGFSTATPNGAKPVFRAWTCNALDPPAGPGCTGNDSNQNYNQLIRNLEIDLNGNAGAIGIDMRSAEGSGIGNVKIDATGAFAGVNNLPGSGGSIQDLEVDGGQYGLYAADAQPSPTVSGLKLVNQTVNAIYYNGSSPLTVVGFNITKASGPAIGGLALSGSSVGGSPGASNLDLVDGWVNFTGGSNNRVIEHTDRNLYARNVYVWNGKYIGYNIDSSCSSSCGDTIANVSGQWTNITEYSRTKDLPQNVRLVDGSYEPNTTVILNQSSNSNQPPANLLSQHVATKVVPTFEDPGVINAVDYGATSVPSDICTSSSPDSTAALRVALSAGTKVFLPAGTYCISGTLTLGASSKFFGLTHAQSIIAPMPSWSAANATPMVTTVDDPNATTVLANIKIQNPPAINHINALTWRAGRNSTVYYPWIKPVCTGGCGGSPPAMQRVIITGAGGGRWFNIWGEVSGDTQNNGSRFLLVDSTTEPLWFYQMHGQYQQSEANNEFRNASNITVYGFKSENQTANNSILKITGSNNIAIYGHQSNAWMNPGLSLVKIINSNNILITNLARFTNNCSFVAEQSVCNTPGGSDWYYIAELNSSGTVLDGLTADGYGGIFRRGTFIAP